MRRFFSRFLLVALIVVAAVAVIRLTGGSGAEVAIDNVDAEGDVERRAFELYDQAWVAIEAAGSYERGGADSVLAAQAWVVRRATGEVVWRMPAGQRPERGSFVSVRDTVELDAGVYDAYYAALGDPLVRPGAQASGSLGKRVRQAISGGGREWIGDAGRWRFALDLAYPDTDRGLLDRIYGEPPDGGADVVWNALGLRDLERRQTLLRAETPATLLASAVFEATARGVADSAYVIASATGDTLWATRHAGSAWAGGSVKNRAQTDTLRLDPGLYRVVATTDTDHNVGSWTANPPWQPHLWGLRLDYLSGQIGEVDAIGGLPRIAAIACVSDGGADEALQFDVLRPVTATVVAVGEVIGTSVYDYGTVERVGADGRTDRVWHMTDNGTTSAGGQDKNRRGEAAIAFQPGTYRLTYHTDGSYHCGSFGGGAPEPDDFWGIALLASDLSAMDAFEVSASTPIVEVPANPDAPPPPPNPPPPTPPAGALARLTGLGNDATVETTFELDAETRVCVVGVGELLPSERLDYGWIEDTEGEVVWELTRSNSERAGGASKNRVGSAALTLVPGTYTAHFRTNGRHAAGAFEGGAPDAPEAWGLEVRRLRAGESVQDCLPLPYR